MLRISLVIGLLCSFLVADSRADDAAVATQLEALGGKVTVKEGSVREIFFRDSSKLGDAEFRAIGKLAHLKTLTLYGNVKGLDDTTLPHLAGLQELEQIGLDGARLSDDGLKHFAALKGLRFLSFFHLSFRLEGFTGVGLAALKECPKLERLTVAGMSMGDAGFAAIATITQLRELSTWHTYQSEAANQEIAKLTNLRALKMGQRLPWGGGKAVSLSDASLPTFATIKTLETLSIGEAHFTVAGLAALKSLPALKKLELWQTDMSAEEVEVVKKEFPDVKVDWKPLTDEQRKSLENYLKQ
ncbi:MAG: hypothetical protein K8U03_06835 [Planctomycetia bacterium]|nr:hypothetical protein [Planctomycetia bacterium]